MNHRSRSGAGPVSAGQAEGEVSSLPPIIVAKSLPTWLRERDRSVLQLWRLPVRGIGAGLFLFGCGLSMAGLASLGLSPGLTGVALQLGPVFLGLGTAFVVFGLGFHLAINFGYWREIRDDEREGQVILSGRKRFERRKKKRRRREKNGKTEPLEVMSRVFDALD